MPGVWGDKLPRKVSTIAEATLVVRILGQVRVDADEHWVSIVSHVRSLS